MRQTERPIRKTFPINVILDGGRVLVVGGGKVGRRKVRLLEAAGAIVDVRDPQVTRAFAAGDTKGYRLVFACTDDKFVNQAVLKDARANHVPCCVSDMNWADGDFTTPAPLFLPEATVAVSTNGASCRSAKEIRNEIGEFLKRRANGRVVALGTSDRFLDAEHRAPFHLPPEARAKMVAFIRELKGVDELVVLNTCNRVEVVISGDVNLELVAHLMRFHRLRNDQYFVLENAAAFAHLVKVASGLESAFAGEFHVVSQVKDALEEATRAGTLGGRLKGFFDDVLRVSKDVRHAVEPYLDVQEIETAAAELVRAKGAAGALRVCVLGSGQVGTGVKAALAGYDVRAVHHGEKIPACDCLVCALACEEPAVTAATLPEGGVPYILDLGMPPNVAPDVPHVTLDQIKQAQRLKSGAAEKIRAAAENVIRENLGTLTFS